MYNLDLVDAAFKDAFPARSELASVEYVSVEAKDGALPEWAAKVLEDANKSVGALRPGIQRAQLIRQ